MATATPAALSNRFYNQPAIERNAMNPAAKYRPVLTAVQIEQILYLAKSEQPMTAMSMSLISTLSPFQAKIQNAAMAPAYVVVGASKPSEVEVMESLGGILDVMAANKTTPIDWSGLSKQEYWEACYNKFKTDRVSCNLSEIAASKEHAYLNDLMSPEELAEFEADFNSVKGDKI
jgi:hypothetical protein